MTPHELVPHGWLILSLGLGLFFVAYIIDAWFGK